MKNKRVLLVGGGGHCKSVLDSLLKQNEFSEIGIIEKKGNKETQILGVPVIGFDEDLQRLYNKGYGYAFVTLGSIGTPFSRIKLFALLEEIGFELPNIIDVSAIVSDNVKLEKGIYIGKNAVINAGAVIGKCTIINTSVTVEHDCVIGAFTHVSPGAVLCGEVKTGENTHIGANSVVKQGVEIGANTIIGMGSVVLENVNDNELAYGNPCKVVKEK